MPLTFIANSQDPMMTIAKIGLLTLFFFIAALVLSKTTKCIVIWHWWDIIFIALSGFILFFSAYEGSANIALNILFLLSLMTTFSLSIYANIKYSGSKKLKLAAFIVIAIGAKIFIAILIPAFIFLLIGTRSSAKKDKRHKSGIKPDQHTLIAGILAVISTFLISTLIKNGDDEELNDDDELIDRQGDGKE